MKNVAKIEIILHDPYSNALWEDAGQNDDIQIMRLKKLHVRYLTVYLNLHLPNYDVKYRFACPFTA